VPGRLAVLICDGLSASAVQRHVPPLLARLAPRLERMEPLLISTQGRVALGDEVGAAVGAEAVLVLIGERPGLSSPDSLGAYLTCPGARFLPAHPCRAGSVRSDHGRIDHCVVDPVSNVRLSVPGGSQPAGGEHLQIHVVWAATERKRHSARARNNPPISPTTRNCGQTMSRSAPRYRIACAKETKCVDGEACMTVASQGGMLCNGVLPPDSMFIGR